MAANVEASARCFGWTELGFSFHPGRVARTTPDLLWSQTTARRWFTSESPQVCWRKIRKADGCLWFLSFASPRISPSAYTLAYRCRHALRTSDERGTSPVKLTNHFPQAKPPTTLTLGLQLTVSAADRRTSECGPPCFTISRKLALRLGRIVFIKSRRSVPPATPGSPVRVEDIVGHATPG